MFDKEVVPDDEYTTLLRGYSMLLSPSIFGITSRSISSVTLYATFDVNVNLLERFDRVFEFPHDTLLVDVNNGYT